MPLDLHWIKSIQEKRDEILKFFDQKSKIISDGIYAISESGLFYFESEKYVQNDPERNWIITRIMIFDMEIAKLIYDILQIMTMKLSHGLLRIISIIHFLQNF